MSITSISYSSKKKKKKKGSDGFAHGLNMATVIDEEKKQKTPSQDNTTEVWQLHRAGNETTQVIRIIIIHHYQSSK